MVRIHKPTCQMQRGLPSKDRRKGWDWLCRVCGFSSRRAEGIKAYSRKPPPCPCVEMNVEEQMMAVVAVLPDQTVDEWAEDERRRLAEFVEHWKLASSVDSEHWPEKMPAGEWDEQFRVYESQ